MKHFFQTTAQTDYIAHVVPTCIQDVLASLSTIIEAGDVFSTCSLLQLFIIWKAGYKRVRAFALVKFNRMEKFSLVVPVGDLMVLCWHFQILNLILR